MGAGGGVPLGAMEGWRTLGEGRALWPWAVGRLVVTSPEGLLDLQARAQQGMLPQHFSLKKFF